MKKYLLGDSHACEMYIEWSKIFPDIEWKSLSSCGIQRAVRKNNRKSFTQEFINEVWNIVEKLEKNSLIFLSMTDPDSRLGMKGFENFIFQDYETFFDKFKKITQYKYLFVLDWFSIKDVEVAEMSCTPEKRVKNRRLSLDALKVMKEKDLITDFFTTAFLPEFENGDGFCIETSFMVDDVHYNFRSAKCKEFLLPIFESTLKLE